MHCSQVLRDLPPDLELGDDDTLDDLGLNLDSGLSDQYLQNLIGGSQPIRPSRPLSLDSMDLSGLTCGWMKTYIG